MRIWKNQTREQEVIVEITGQFGCMILLYFQYSEAVDGVVGAFWRPFYKCSALYVQWPKQAPCCYAVLVSRRGESQEMVLGLL